MKQTSARGGLTVIELTISLGISVALFALVAQVIGGLSHLSSTTLSVGRAEEAASQVSEAMSSEIRWADPETLLITAENGSSRVDFRVSLGYDGSETIWSTPVVYRFEPSDRDANGNGIADEGRLVRIQDGRTRTLCRNVPVGGLSISQKNETIAVEVGVFTKDAQGRLLQRTAEAVTHLLNRTSW